MKKLLVLTFAFAVLGLAACATETEEPVLEDDATTPTEEVEAAIDSMEAAASDAVDAAEDMLDDAQQAGEEMMDDAQQTGDEMMEGAEDAMGGDGN